MGHGAMGETYKAFYIDLRRPVTLKVISESISATDRRAFVLARSAFGGERARSRVASVFRLGRSGGDGFYGMEFVQGETLGL